jgi:hypothetical protein
MGMTIAMEGFIFGFELKQRRGRVVGRRRLSRPHIGFCFEELGLFDHFNWMTGVFEELFGIHREKMRDVA